MFPKHAIASLALATALLAPVAASAITVKNCSGVPVRVHVYNDSDSVQIIGRKGGLIEAGSKRSWGVGNGRVLVKVFRSGFIDKLVVTRGNLRAKSGYHIDLDKKGNWSVRKKSGGC